MSFGTRSLCLWLSSPQVDGRETIDVVYPCNDCPAYLVIAGERMGLVPVLVYLRKLSKLVNDLELRFTEPAGEICDLSALRCYRTADLC